MTDADMSRPANADRRKAALAQAVSREMANGSWRMESQSDYQAILVKGGRTNHLLHLILTFLTAFLWLFVWIPIVIANRRRTLILTVDDYGNILRQES
ncbi:hypothetical protein [Gordonia iterans]